MVKTKEGYKIEGGCEKNSQATKISQPQYSFFFLEKFSKDNLYIDIYINI